MARTQRIYYQSAVYHISIRGNNKQAILQEEEDKKEFLVTLAKFRTRFSFKLLGFVLMDNHVHMIIATNELINISKIMQAITLSYSQKFRHKYRYTGYVWQGRFRSNVIADDRYIIECLNYIHNNPVRAKIVDCVEDYLWSSYHIYHANQSHLEELIHIDRFSP